jgi:hypothetical protein
VNRRNGRKGWKGWRGRKGRNIGRVEGWKVRISSVDCFVFIISGDAVY